MTSGAKNKLFESNYRTLVSASALYQADNNGLFPESIYELQTYVDVETMNTGKPEGSKYELATDDNGMRCIIARYDGMVMYFKLDYAE